MPAESVLGVNSGGKIEGKERKVLRVLIAEDHKAIRDELKYTLEERGYIVEAVSNGQLLMDELLNGGKSYDLVITDKQMPVKTGIEVIEDIRANEKFKNLPIILITGDYDPDGRLHNNVIKLGASAYIEKPFSSKKLHETIDELIPESLDLPDKAS